MTREKALNNIVVKNHPRYSLILQQLVNNIFDHFKPLEKELAEHREMITWMEDNSNQSLCDYYNR